MKISIKISILFLALSLVWTSCEKDETPSVNPLEGLTLLNEGYAVGAGTVVQIWADRSYFMGYNRVQVVLLDSADRSKKIEDAHIHFKPMMTMLNGAMTMKHSCPTEDPEGLAKDGVFAGAIAFVMPTSDAGFWKLDVDVHNHANDLEGTAAFDIQVTSPSQALMSVFTSTEEAKPRLVLSLVEPTTPKVGMNDIRFALHRRADAMNWPADDSYTIEIEPEMPSMGHGSPNNVHPSSVGNGHYVGKVNFTMTGEWQINVVLKKNGTPVSDNLSFVVVL